MDIFISPNKKIKLINGDSFGEEVGVELLEHKEKADLILTDPPYNIADKGKVVKLHGKIYSNKEAWGDTYKDNFTPEEYDEFIRRFFNKALFFLKPGASLFSFIDRKYAGKFADIGESYGFIYKNEVTFMKINAVPKVRAFNFCSATEKGIWMITPNTGKKTAKTKPAIFNSKPPTKNLRHPDGQLDIKKYHNTCSSNIFLHNIGGKKLIGHPNEKYQAQIEPILEHLTNRDSLVVDLFAGCFAIGVACNKLGRQFIGIEQKKEFYDKGVAFYTKNKVGEY